METKSPSPFLRSIETAILSSAMIGVETVNFSVSLFVLMKKLVWSPSGVIPNSTKR